MLTVKKFLTCIFFVLIFMVLCVGSACGESSLPIDEPQEQGQEQQSPTENPSDDNPASGDNPSDNNPSSDDENKLTEEEIALLSDEEYFTSYFMPNVRFSVASDVHIGKSNTETEEERFAAFFKTAYEYAKGQEYTKLDGAFIAGDIVDTGSATEFSKAKSILNRNARSQTKTRVILGNHEFRTEGAISRLRNTFGYRTDDEHTIINGYHFLFLSQDERDAFSDADAAWLSTELAIAAADDPTGKKPIFIFQHEPNVGTTVGGVITNLYDIVKPYPQVVNFTAHTHESIKDPRCIHQKDFTSVSTGGLSIYEFNLVNTPYTHAMAIGQEEGYTGAFTPYSAYPTKNMAEYWIVEADARGAIVLKGYDITGDKFVIEYRLRGVGDTEKFVYTEDRAESAPNPTFGGGAALTVTKVENKKRLEIRIPQANESEYVNNYRVELYKGEELIDTKYALSGMFFANIPEYVQVAFTGVESGEYTVKAYAVSSWGKESAPLVSDVTFTAETVVNTVLPDAFALEYEQASVDQSNWYSRNMREVSFGTRYAGETVSIKLEVNGNLSAQDPEEVLGIRTFFYDQLNAIGFISIPTVALSTTAQWTTVYVDVLLNENGSIWMTAEGRSNYGVYTINVRNITLLEEPSAFDVLASLSSWGDNDSYTESYHGYKDRISVCGDDITIQGHPRFERHVGLLLKSSAIAELIKRNVWTISFNVTSEMGYLNFYDASETLLPTAYLTTTYAISGTTYHDWFIASGTAVTIDLTVLALNASFMAGNGIYLVMTDGAWGSGTNDTSTFTLSDVAFTYFTAEEFAELEAAAAAEAAAHAQYNAALAVFGDASNWGNNDNYMERYHGRRTALSASGNTVSFSATPQNNQNHVGILLKPSAISALYALNVKNITFTVNSSAGMNYVSFYDGSETILPTAYITTTFANTGTTYHDWFIADGTTVTMDITVLVNNATFMAGSGIYIVMTSATNWSSGTGAESTFTMSNIEFAFAE